MFPWKYSVWQDGWQDRQVWFIKLHQFSSLCRLPLLSHFLRCRVLFRVIQAGGCCSAAVAAVTVLQPEMNNFPSDPDTGVCLSGGLASLSRQPAVTSQTDSQERDTDPARELREEGNIGSIITMLITDQVRKSDQPLFHFTGHTWQHLSINVNSLILCLEV